MLRGMLVFLIIFFSTSACLADSAEDTLPAKGLVASIAERLVDVVEKTVSTLRYSVYKLGGSQFDPPRGVYVVDCSSYVDHVLQKASPRAYHSLVNSTGVYAPTTEQYYNFFIGLKAQPRHYWNQVEAVKQLRPGDILVFRTNSKRHRRTSGHVMVVMNKPVSKSGSFLVRVADSAPLGHGHDTRPPHVSGIGIGTMLLKVNPKTGKPSAYAWKQGSGWNPNVKFAMARIVDPNKPLYPPV